MANGSVYLEKSGRSQSLQSAGGLVAANTPVVVTGIFNAGGTSLLRVNGVQVAAGTGLSSSVSSGQMGVMSNGANAEWAAGTVGFCEVSNTILSLADLQAAERAAAKSVGVTLP